MQTDSRDRQIETQFGQIVTGRVVEKYWAATVYTATPADDPDGQDYLLTRIAPRPNYPPHEIQAQLDRLHQLDHPNVLPLLESGTAPDGTFYTLVENLPAVLSTYDNLPLDEILVFSEQASAALDYIHEWGLAHGNLASKHLVYDGQGTIFLRGLELSANEVEADPLKDIIALSKLVQHALTGYGGDVAGLRGIPRGIVAVFRHAQRGGFETAGAFHAAFKRAITAEGKLLIASSAVANAPSEPLRAALPVSHQRPDLNRPASPGKWQIIISVMIPILGGIIGSILFLNQLRQHAPQAVEPTGAVFATSLTPTNIPPTASPTPNPTNTPLPAATLTEPTFVAMVDPTTQTLLPPTFTPERVVTATGMSDPGTLAPSMTNTDAPPPTLDPNIPTLPDAVVNVDDGVILRGGPGRDYYAILTLRKDRTMSVISRTSDNIWLQVRADKSEGWVASQYVTVNVNLANVQVVTPEEIDRIPRTRSCVSLVGDSVPHGDAIVEFPDVGFAMINLEPLGTFVDQKLKEIGLTDTYVSDRSVSGTGISVAIRSAYRETGQFQSLLNDRCRYIVILPWVGDLSQSTNHTVDAQVHATALAELVRDISDYNPYSRILLMDYYSGAPTNFMQTSLAKGFNRQGVITFNKAIADSCAAGELSRFKQVSCLHSDPIFAGLGLTYLIGPMTRQQFELDIIGGMDDNETKLLNEYLAGHPDGPLIGDGIHLNTLGKTILAEFLVKQITSLSEYRPSNASPTESAATAATTPTDPTTAP